MEGTQKKAKQVNPPRSLRVQRLPRADCPGIVTISDKGIEDVYAVTILAKPNGWLKLLWMKTATTGRSILEPHTCIIGPGVEICSCPAMEFRKVGAKACRHVMATQKLAERLRNQ